jgi:hypothetical protein
MWAWPFCDPTEYIKSGDRIKELVLLCSSSSWMSFWKLCFDQEMEEMVAGEWENLSPWSSHIHLWGKQERWVVVSEDKWLDSDGSLVLAQVRG